MPKYKSLQTLLQHQSGVADFTLDELDTLIPGGLPPSAYLYEAWWSTDDPSHHQSDAWRDAGYRAQVDLERKQVRFVPC